MNWELGAFVALLLLSGLFSASETAYTSLTLDQISRLAKNRGNRGRLVARIMDRPDLLISTILIGNNIVNIAASSLATLLTLSLFGDDLVALATGVVTLLVLIFGEVTPKQIALIHNEFIAVHMARVLFVLTRLFLPFSWALNLFSSLVVKLLGGRKARTLSLEGLLATLSMAETQGVVSRQDNKIVRAVVRSFETPLKAVMTHRTDIFSLPETTTVAEALPLWQARGFSRIPVWRGNPENVTGIVRFKDLYRAEGRRDRPLKDFLRPTLLVPESRRIRDMLLDFARKDLNMSVVYDEYGGLAGLVTRNDLMSDLFGDLFDHTGPQGQPARSTGDKITVLGPNRWSMGGDLPLHHLTEALGLEFGETEAETLAGWLVEQLERLAQQGDQVSHARGSFRVTEVRRHSIEEVIFEAAEASDPEA